MEAVYTSDIPQTETSITFEEMYLLNRKLMMHTAMKILNNFADAEDCVSEAFLRTSKIFPKISHLERPKLTSLLVIIVRNAALDKYRANKRVVALEEPDIDTGTYYTDSYSFDSVIEAIGHLKDEYRDVLMLKFVYGYNTREMSDILGITSDNIYKRIQRAKAELARIIEKEG
ncbi:MAG: ECF RNA polymerase sigma factor SigR [Firmicutes bacterium ADurb.BinA205]|nr:MAG: ECF RNA polymerase sigma factor SigR [Firmicutes bacterium ADurb.BinA205]